MITLLATLTIVRTVTKHSLDQRRPWCTQCAMKYDPTIQSCDVRDHTIITKAFVLVAILSVNHFTHVIMTVVKYIKYRQYI